MTSISKSSLNYIIKPVSENDRSRIIDFFKRFFFRDEPLNNALGMHTEENPVPADLVDYACSDLGDFSFLAEYNGEIIGVCLNGIIEKGKSDDTPEPTDERFLKIFKLLKRTTKEADPFKHFPEDTKGISVRILSVDESYRGKGIAKELISKTMLVAKENGCGFIYVECSSHFTAKVVQRLGLFEIYRLNYADFKLNGNVVLTPEYPHEAITAYVKKL